ncbi:1-phosphofructokinase family hexose kinase [Actinosynnema mirum]|uniref:PfkB domain protein n=1 Tax=Actinosynnema mirum (strain ATCC 29888 / DSM 43827 / JCM 3225 / NBRC 14064 / NCIMB 13271 / NRRL B-12336 / IMRU 3971 / 101) TaxID=446462 RepID=C6WQT0_ACTMD|nr:PfkB family carbohydrate kinase [Actinosynnema mirum]ACU38770.1 PfkB domain protein [Actinosynnema mirum DSM 43827]
MTELVAVFAPSPQLTVTVEDLDGAPDIHLHAGGQGVWQSRMISSLGAEVVLIAALGGETGEVLRNLVGVELKVLDVTARNGAYVHDRRAGERETLVEMPADHLSRHELDDLYELALVECLRAEVAVLSGPNDDVVPDEVYRRLTADLRGQGRDVVVDLSGGRLAAALEGGPTVVKVSHDELVEDGRSKSDAEEDLVAAMREIAECGARAVVVSRASEPTLALIGSKLYEVTAPGLSTVDTKGGGDSMTAGLAAGLALGIDLEEALRLGAAAGSLNVTRHGLGTGGGEAVQELAARVDLRVVEGE